MPNYAELMEAIERLESTTYGDPSRDKKGLVERVNSLETSMNEIRDFMRKVLWLLVAGVAGAGLNLILNARNAVQSHQQPAAQVAK